MSPKPKLFEWAKPNDPPPPDQVYTSEPYTIPLHPPQEFDRWFWDHRSMERPGDTRSQRPSALQAEAPAELSPGHSIDWGRAPLPVPANIWWYRHRAEECGDLAAEMMDEGIEGTAYGAAYRAGHFGRIVQALDAERRADWRVPGHAGNFL